VAEWGSLIIIIIKGGRFLREVVVFIVPSTIYFSVSEIYDLDNLLSGL
jgi:hypothetical protein